MAELYNISLNTLKDGSDEKVPEIPLLDQNDYADVSYFRNGNLAKSGCGIVSYSMVLSYLFDDLENYTPEKLAELYEGTYGGKWGTDRSLFDETPQDYGLTVEHYDAWDGLVNTKAVQTALENGQPVIALVGKGSGLTSQDGGHYVVFTGITEDGKILVNDPNGNNYDKSSLTDKFENGFDVSDFTSYAGLWIFPSKESVQSGALAEKDTSQLITEILEKAETTTPTVSTPTTSTSTSTTTTKPTTTTTTTTNTTTTKPTTTTTPTEPTIDTTTTTTSDKDEKKWDEENPAWAQAVETAISSTGTRTRTTTSTTTNTTTNTTYTEPTIDTTDTTDTNLTTDTTDTNPTTTTTTTTKPTTTTTTTKPTTPTTPSKPSKPSIPSISEPEHTDIPVMQCTPEAVLKAAKNMELTENNSNYLCNLLHSSGYITEEELNMYKNWDISEICKQLDERGWNKVTNTSELKNGDIIIVNNGEEIRVYAGNNSWYAAGETEIQQGNENWAENTNWVAYRPD